MITYERQNSEHPPEITAPSTEDHIAPAPRVSVQAFCETVETAAAVQSAGEDRRLGKAHLKIQMGGMAAAIEAYRSFCQLRLNDVIARWPGLSESGP